MSARHDVPMAVHAAREGDGYWKSKGDQWQLLCPHMSSTAKIALGILCSLTGQTHPVRKLTAAEFAGLLTKGPVAPGEDPKGMSTGGAIRVLRELADLGQITRPDGTRLTISSRPTAELSICVWKRPRHDCGCARNVHDALNALRGEPCWFPSASAGENSDQAPKSGENSDQSGQNSHQAGQNSAKTPPPTCDDAAPLSSSPSSSSLSGRAATSEAVPAAEAEVVTEEREGATPKDNRAVPPQRAEQAAPDTTTPGPATVLVDAWTAQRKAHGHRTSNAAKQRVHAQAAALLDEGYAHDTLRRALSAMATTANWRDLEIHLDVWKDTSTTRDRSTYVPPCGECGPNRWIDLPDGRVARCPNCHPANVAA